MPRGSIGLLIGAAVFGGFIAYVWLRRGSPGAKSMLLILAAGVEYSVFYALEVNSSDIASKQMWGDIKYLGICFLPIAWLAFTLEYTGRRSWLSRRWVGFLAVEPLVVLTLLAIPATSHLVHMFPVSSASTSVVTFGPVGWFNFVYSYGLIAISTGLFVATLGRIGRPYRRQARMVMASLAIPLVLNLLYNLNVGPFGTFDLTSFGFVLTALVMIWGILRLRLLDIVPVARSVVLETLEDGVVVLDAFSRIADLNPAAERVLGSSSVDALGRPIGEVLPDVAFLVERAPASGSVNAEIRLSRTSGLRDYEVTVSPLPGGSRRATARLLVLRDVTERKLAEERLERLAHYDALTGLPNRKLFGDRLNQAILRARRNPSLVGLLFFDVDDFKDVNDTLGHDVGDAVLTELAARVQACVRAEDTVARLSGDEFTVILPDLDAPSDAAIAASRVLEAIGRPLSVGNRRLHITASVGICLWPNDGDSPMSILRNADVAMYRAKATKNRFEFYSRDLSIQAARRVELEEELRQALDRSELRLHYQPIVALGSNRVVALEALLRWQHPTRGLLGPADFLWRAEETGLIERIGAWVLDEACGQAKWWGRDRQPGSLGIAVNVGARELRHPGLVSDVEDVLRRTRLHPKALILEISEEVVMGEIQSTIATLHKLKALGVRLALDDFGTGSTSLTVLRRFPLDIVKIDRVFVDGLDRNSEDELVVGATVGLSHALGFVVVAEGVETRAQLRALENFGCDQVQGFLFSRPVPAQRVPSLLAATSWAVGAVG